MNEEDSTVASAVGSCIEVIARIIDSIAERVRRNGRVVYIGAGTSGRLGILDASEIPPTFSAPYSLFIGMMAGGDSAIRRAAEGAEDSTTQPIADLAAITPPLTPFDTLIGIATSGRTPYVLAGLSHAKDDLHMLTVGLACVKPSQIRYHCDHVIECVVGPEIVTGSTRMKAGTATKLILNMISTGVMIRIGKTFGNMMVDLRLSNNKLVDRARRIFRTLHPATTYTDEEIDKLIASCNGSVKLALVVAKLGCSTEEGIKKLEAAGGVLKKAWQIDPAVELSATGEAFVPETHRNQSLVLCVDAGGTKCSVTIADKTGVIAQVVGGPCNFATMGHQQALSTLAKVINDALDTIPPLHAGHPRISTGPKFAAAWIGGAGLDRELDLVAVRPPLLRLLKLQDPAKLYITNDAALLASAIATNNSPSSIESGVILLTGTGSIAYSYRLSSNSGPTRSILPIPIERSGGWGYLLGDEGSAYYIGKTALQRALRARDEGVPPTNLHRAILEHFGCKTIGEILSFVYKSSQSSSTGLDLDPKLRIASLSPLVLGLAFPSNGSKNDEGALDVVRRSASAAAELVIPLLVGNQAVEASQSVLILGGALAQVEGYRRLILDALRERGKEFLRVEVVNNAGQHAVQLLINGHLV
ncbi:hypothetical protein AMATHDRAFT_9933 [Amanita thiersii Skay4041]|uniref:N-acetyl-D-glucosamine kinase n=1 Tax=Amanita thiersii Skay4041 TaxID=703135 RepID=A0A2A9NA65_9AGAR|nr:hypothetical protein AMATHDRAFT_9933 [Amanita thiersii Skay4041]